MRVVDLPGRARVLVLGEGQVGAAVVASLRLRRSRDEWSWPTNWSTPARAARSIVDGLDAIGPSPETFVLVWAAGAAGMMSTADYCERSLETMQEALLAVRGHRHADPVAVHLIGSAGAAAVGRPRWSGKDDPPPRGAAPYVQLKQAEERLVRGMPGWETVIHRATSVYGPPGRPGRTGMVTTLVWNAARNRTTPVYGSWSTLRNYVHADDVGADVADAILHPSGSQVRVLAAHRSHSIAELVGLIAESRRRPVPIRLLPAANAEHLTIDPGAVAPTFSPRPLETAVRQMVLELRRRPIAAG